MLQDYQQEKHRGNRSRTNEAGGIVSIVI